MYNRYTGNTGKFERVEDMAPPAYQPPPPMPQDRQVEAAKHAWQSATPPQFFQSPLPPREMDPPPNAPPLVAPWPQEHTPVPPPYQPPPQTTQAYQQPVYPPVQQPMPIHPPPQQPVYQPPPAPPVSQPPPGPPPPIRPPDPVPPPPPVEEPKGKWSVGNLWNMPTGVRGSLKGILPESIDLGDIVLVIVLIYLFLEGDDDDMLIVLGVLLAAWLLPLLKRDKEEDAAI